MLPIEQQLKKKRRKEARFRDVLKSLGRFPDAVIDIGVRRGTPSLYDAFPDVPFLLIDPQARGERLLHSRPHNYTFLNKAIGRCPGRMVFHDDGGKSSFLTRTALTAAPLHGEREVEIVTLDDVISQYLPNARKIGVKIDTEGFELDVVAGLKTCTARVDFIITETSVMNRFLNSYNFSELVCELWANGFRFYNILGGLSHPVPGMHYDCIFFHKDDPAFDAIPERYDASSRSVSPD